MNNVKELELPWWATSIATHKEYGSCYVYDNNETEVLISPTSYSLDSRPFLVDGSELISTS